MSEIFKHKTDFMRQLMNSVSKGYFFYTSGNIDPKKFESLHYKFCDRYQIDRNTQQRYRAKLKGICNSKLIAWLDGDSVQWVLLVTDGEGLVGQLESLSDVRNKKSRLTVDAYELVKEPRKGQEAAWTWRMCANAYREWEERIKTSIRQKNEDRIRQALWSLKRIPGFRSVRQQAFKLLSMAKGEWKRSMRSEWPHGDIFIGWQGRFKKPALISLEEIKKISSKK